VLYRVACEGVSNALRHGAPRLVTIRVAADHRAARIEIEDDGRGFDVADAERRRPGMGLASIRDRLSLVDGGMDVQSRPGAGTRVLATVPLAPA
jgi:signal transduction histidine kinase